MATAEEMLVLRVQEVLHHARCRPVGGQNQQACGMGHLPRLLMLVMNGEFGKRLADADRFSVCATQRQGTQDKKAAADEVAKGHGWGSRFESDGGHRRLFKSVWRVHGQVAKSAHSGASTSSIQYLC